ncbi:Uncharacterised protein [Enterobacter hormaechei]|nr:hypothetical protein [Enterobacter hormaechei]CZV16066.1 Uncharacterised protein [Enterobacter hormaechei]CZV57909.1 Uncharacterised protein [Enterobacter hormaechei]CZW02289.1 Uncharacterised protein [Enterobacter hormaechei]CZZ14301.1 Uncharacterised protein [Enterobacter hormaechei]SAC19280.1 Uncharacterised protein [Enterobacter hormaechei]
MMKKIILLGVASAFAVNVYANNTEQGFKENDRASSYVKCALYADISNIYTDKSSAVPDENAKQFRILALKHWRRANELLGNVKTGDDEIVDFAAYLSSQESVAWDVHPEMNNSNNDRGNPATAAYMSENCGLLLDAAK